LRELVADLPAHDRGVRGSSINARDLMDVDDAASELSARPRKEWQDHWGRKNCVAIPYALDSERGREEVERIFGSLASTRSV